MTSANSFNQNDFELRLAKVLLDEIQKGSVSFEDGRVIARHILLRLPSLKDSKTRMDFLHDLALKWKMFENLSQMEDKKSTYEKSETEKIDQIKLTLSKYIKPS